MKRIYDVPCDYCGAVYQVRMHAAEFKRCTGGGCCERAECREKNTAEISARVREMLGFVGLDPFYELHVWAWRDNPKGTFADMNPSVSCEHAHAHGK